MKSRCPGFCSPGSPRAQNLVATQQWDLCTTFFWRAEVVSGGWCPLATGRSIIKSSLEEVFPCLGVQDSHRLRSSHELTRKDHKTHEKAGHREREWADITHSRYWNCQVENTALLCNHWRNKEWACNKGTIRNKQTYLGKKKKKEAKLLKMKISTLETKCNV